MPIPPAYMPPAETQRKRRYVPIILSSRRCSLSVVNEAHTAILNGTSTTERALMIEPFIPALSAGVLRSIDIQVVPFYLIIEFMREHSFPGNRPGTRYPRPEMRLKAPLPKQGVCSMHDH